MLAAGIFVLLALSRVVDGQVYGYSVHATQFDCTGKEDGLAMIGCDGYTECRSNVAIRHYCSDTQYFDRDSMTCLSAHSGQSCTQYNVCHNLNDGRYADPQKNCQTYYTCHGHTFFGHEYCPGGLVFNEALQICDWPNHVLFPCGTKQQTG